MIPTTHNERNLPLRVTLPENVTARYRYSASGQRIRTHTHSTQVFDMPDGDPVDDPRYAVRRFVRDGSRLVAVLDGEGTLLHWNLHGAAGTPIGRIDLLGDNIIRREVAEQQADSLLAAETFDLLHAALVTAGLSKSEAYALAGDVESAAEAVLRQAVVPSVAAALDEAGLAPDTGGSHFAGLVGPELAAVFEAALVAAGYKASVASDLAKVAAAEAASLGAQRVQQGIEVAVSYDPGGYTVYSPPKYYVTDHLGSVRAVVDGYDGSVVEARDYYPFGLQMPGRVYVQGSETREGYTGHELDAETGLLYMGARYYDPALGRIYSVDPLASEFPSHSPYNYALGNPISLMDPDGAAPVCPSCDIRQNQQVYERTGVRLPRPNPGLVRAAGEIAVGFTPAGWALDVRDARAAIRDRDAVGGVLAGVGFLGGFGDAVKAGGRALRGMFRGADDVVEGVADARGIMRSFQEGSGDFDAPRAMSTDESNSLGMSALGGDPIPMRNRRTGEIVGYRSQNGSVDYRYPQMKTRGQAAGRTQANLVGYRIDKNGNRVEIRNMHIDIE